MCPVEGYDPSALEAVQLEDGSTAYIHHPVSEPSDSAVLAVQTEVGLEDLAAEDEEAFSADTVVALEQYASKVSTQSPALPFPGEEGLAHPPPPGTNSHTLLACQVPGTPALGLWRQGLEASLDHTSSYQTKRKHRTSPLENCGRPVPERSQDCSCLSPLPRLLLFSHESF